MTTFEKALADLAVTGVPGTLPSENRTVRIPSDYPNLQAAFDAEKSRAYNNYRIRVLIESGYVISSGLYLENGDYSNFRIASEDAEVSLSGGFNNSERIMDGLNVRLPIWGILVNANSRSAGIRLQGVSSLHVEPGRGVKNSWANGIMAFGGSTVYAENTIWTGNAVNGNTGSGITMWGAHGDFQGADVSNSGYYGAQAAAGGILNFRDGIANSCGRYGVRATNAGWINFHHGEARSNQVYGIYAFNGSWINARNAVATGNGQSGAGGNVQASSGSTICFREGQTQGGQDFSVRASQGSHIDATGADCRRLGSQGSQDIVVSVGSTIAAGGSIGGTNQGVNNLTANGYITR